jgi:glutamate/aspartate transport system permease protein
MISFDLSFFQLSLFANFVVKGLLISLQLTVVAALGGLVLGTVLALMRLSNRPILSRVAAVYVNGMRSIPLVVVVLWFYMLMPLLLGKPIGAMTSAYVTFTLFEAAYFAEIMRAGILSVRSGQFSAGRALGMNYRQLMQHVVLPQAGRNMLPILMTQLIILFQDTSLVYAIGVNDLLRSYELAGNTAGRPVEAFSAAAVTYLVICACLSFLAKRLEKRS